MSQITSIEKLSKENYDTWKLQVEAILIKNDVWSYAIGAEAKPAEGPTQAEQEKLKKWIQSDQKAKADIILSMSPSELCQIKQCTTSNEVWTKLKTIYESKGPAKKATLLKQLLFRKMSETEKMSEHLNKFFETVDKLHDMDIDIADDLLSILLLYSIPESFENFRCAIESRDELPKPEALKIKLLEEWEAKKNKINPDSQKAYFSSHKKGNQYLKQNSENNWKSSQNKNDVSSNKAFKNLKCNYCFKLGHKGSVCRKKIADRKAATQKQPEISMMTKSGEYTATAISMSNTNYNSDTPWIFDSGSTSHMCNDQKQFFQLDKQANSFVKLAIDKSAEVIGKGSVRITVPVKTGVTTIRLDNVLCVPELKCNLLSTSKATAKNRSVIFTEREAKIFESDGTEIMSASRNGDLYYVHPIVETAATVITDFQKWHQKYGHLNEADLKKLKTEDMVRGMNFKNTESLKDCKVCIQGKQTVKPFPKQSKFVSKQLLDLIHSDVCGPMRVSSLAGSRYFVTFIDNKSRYVEVSFLKNKDEVKSAFLKYKAAMENRIGEKIKVLRTDCGLEYCGAEFDEFLEQQGIRREKSSPMTPQQDGVSERMNRTVVEMARCLLIQSNLDPSFWAEAINCAIFLRNRSPTRSLNTNITPYEAFFGVKPSVSYLQIFGQKAYVLNKRLKGKFDPRSEEHIFIGYSSESKAYRLWNKNSRKVITSRDCRFINEFDNDYLPRSENEIQYLFPITPTQNSITPSETESYDEWIPDVMTEASTSRDESRELTADEGSESESPDKPPSLSGMKRGRGRPSIVRGKIGRPKRRYNMVPSDESIQIVVSDPTLREALAGPQSKEWKESMKQEFDALVQQNAWQIVNRPKNKKVIPSKWILKTKYKQDGTVEKLKSRLVAKGCSQITDCQETFSPVARLSSIRTVIAYAIENNLTAYQIDFVMAYINGDIDTEVYMEIPEGFQDIYEGDKVCLLKRSLYGLKTSGRLWYKKLDVTLKTLGFKNLNSDHCVYHIKTADTEAIIIVYVDDLLVFTSDESTYKTITNKLSKLFKMKDMGRLHYCLGIEFMQNNDSITMSQKKYTEDILTKYEMQDAKPVLTPMDCSIKLTKDLSPKNEDEKAEMENIPYRSLIGSLMYLSVGTRPDITYAVNFLSQFNNNPGKAHWMAAKRVLRYLKGTLDYGITFKRDEKPLVAFVDADWASDVNDRKSYTGYIFKLAGGPISWELRKQRTTALSSTEAEYMGLSDVAKETVYIRRFLGEISNVPDVPPTVILCDNQSAQKLIKNPVYHSRTKHIDIRHHFVREVYERGEIDVNFLSSAEMPADMLTKSLSGPRHSQCCKNVNICKV